MTFDIRNAFNTLKWSRIISEIGRRDFPCYLRKIIRAYFVGRRIVYYGAEYTVDRKVHKGVPQGSVIRPLLWKVVYDGLLSIEMSRGTKMVGYADDVALIVTDGRLPSLVEKVETVEK